MRNTTVEFTYGEDVTGWRHVQPIGAGDAGSHLSSGLRRRDLPHHPGHIAEKQVSGSIKRDAVVVSGRGRGIRRQGAILVNLGDPLGVAASHNHRAGQADGHMLRRLNMRREDLFGPIASREMKIHELDLGIGRQVKAGQGTRLSGRYSQHQQH
jgi:hypothetical protein